MARLRSVDVQDSDFLDAHELESDGTAVYLTTTVVSTNSGTQTVTVNLPADGEGLLRGVDHPVEPGDVAIVTGTSGGLGDGVFTVTSIPTDTTFTVLESLGSSSGGSVNFLYPPGARKVGLSPVGLAHVTENTLEGAISQLDSAVFSANQHKAIRQLVHLANEGGPFEGFPSGVYQETLPSASPFPTSVIWWTDASKTAKIVEETIAYNANKTIATDAWKVYATDGSTVLATVTDTILYSGLFELNRTRTIV